jgi:hypothetical protein
VFALLEKNRASQDIFLQQDPGSASARGDHLRWCHFCYPVVNLTILDTILVNPTKWVKHAYTTLKGDVLVNHGIELFVAIGIPDGRFCHRYIKELRITALDCYDVAFIESMATDLEEERLEVRDWAAKRVKTKMLARAITLNVVGGASV